MKKRVTIGLITNYDYVCQEDIYFSQCAEKLGINLVIFNPNQEID